MRLGKVTLDPAVGAFGQFVFGDGREEARGWPALLVGLFGELRPEGLDRRQAQLVEHDAEACFVDMVSFGHAPSPA